MDEDLKKLLEKNLELNQEIYNISRRLNAYMIWATVIGVIKLIVIATPIILGIIYLPDIIQTFMDQLQAFADNPANPTNLSPLILELLVN